jgi:hypothetical protein
MSIRDFKILKFKINMGKSSKDKRDIYYRLAKEQGTSMNTASHL